ncbi:hypothetical protein K445DRAFT_86946 [Daldinia sp. EC12]|nr:hypothetical protein K445DRAFT_86946 [Daldinia sp. EC12]
MLLLSVMFGKNRTSMEIGSNAYIPTLGRYQWIVNCDKPSFVISPYYDWRTVKFALVVRPRACGPPIINLPVGKRKGDRPLFTSFPAIPTHLRYMSPCPHLPCPLWNYGVGAVLTIPAISIQGENLSKSPPSKITKARHPVAEMVYVRCHCDPRCSPHPLPAELHGLSRRWLLGSAVD